MERRTWIGWVGLFTLSITACSTQGQAKKTYQELETERDELARLNDELTSKLSACESRCQTLQQELQTRRGAPDHAKGTLPEELRRQGISLTDNGREAVVQVPSDLFFASGISKLSKPGETALGQIADLLKKNYPEGTIRVDGHSDADPIKRTAKVYHCNTELSFERAHSVYHYLTEKGGIDAKKVYVAAWGEHFPQDPKSKAKNRRVEIVVSKN
jgi:chemotaxis protein MotB